MIAVASEIQNSYVFNYIWGRWFDWNRDYM